MPWLFLGKIPEICNDAVFVDVDYPQLMLKKHAMIDRSDALKAVLPGLEKTGKASGLLCHSAHYTAIGCDLRNLDFLKLVLQEHLDAEACSVAILFVAEVSTAYMPTDGSQAVLEWAAGYDDARFCLLEQHLPDGRDHPFAQTMLKHFDKLRTPLHAIGTIDQMKDRFSNAGWPADGLNIKPLWDLWSDPLFLSPEQRRALDEIEPFDEWEEFALFGSHYFLMVATKPAPASPASPSPPTQLTLPTPTPLTATTLPTPHSHRRFASLLPPAIPPPAFPSLAEILPPTSAPQTSIALHAGLGTNERITTTATYTTSPATNTIPGPPLSAGLMCHTITSLPRSADCLLVGGRASPAQASAACWLRDNGVWEKAADLPEGRYRHNAVPVVGVEGEAGVLVYGGKDSRGNVLDECLLWTAGQGWKRVEEGGDGRPWARFGAVLTVDGEEGCKGLLVGGMGSDGCVLEDEWEWKLEGGKLVWTSREARADGTRFRFGAQVTKIGDEAVLVGGIVGKGMLGRENEVVGLESGRRYPLVGERPMLVGHSMHGQLVLGGGATCFSFGTYWSATSVLRLQSEGSGETQWRLQEEPESPTIAKQPTEIPIERLTLTDETTFDHIRATNKPAVLTNLDLGPCVTKWTPEYLKQTLGPDLPVIVHASPTPKMSFTSKNFTYETQPLSTFLDSIATGAHLYLRSLSATSPSKTPTNLATDFPALAPDFSLPPSLSSASTNAHSAPLRIAGPVAMWLHYDVMANVLCQIRGRKRLLLFPPSDVTKLYFAPGASSSALDVFAASVTTHPALASCAPHVADLAPGDVLYIPPLWLHAAVPLGGAAAEPSVGVNVFFRSLEGGYAAGRDVYGNRDLAAYEKGRKDLGMIARAFRGVPGEVRRFYLERLAGELGDLARGEGGK